MELLVAKGLITKRRGAGTFVKAVAPGMTDQVVHLYREMKEK